MRYFKIEIKRMLLTKSFWISLLIMYIICIVQYISYGLLLGDGYGDWIREYGFGFMMQPSSLFTSWIGGELNSMYMFLFLALLPLISSFAYSTTYYKDRKLGQVKNVLTRVDSGKYYRSKWLTIFLAGFLIAFIPLLSNVYLHLTYSVPLTPILESMTTEVLFDREKWIFDLFYNKPFLYMGLYIFVISIFSGLYATLGMTFSVLVNKSLAAVIGPFILWRFFDLMFSIIGKTNWGMSNQLFPTLGHMNIYIVFVYSLIILTISIAPIYIRWKRKEDF